MDALRDQLKVQGFVAVGPVLSGSEASGLAQAFHEWLGSSPELNEYGLLRNDVWREVPQFREEIRRGRLGRLACKLLGTDEVILFQDNVIEKPARTDTEVCWHQDYSYWPLDRPQGLTFWVALSPADEANGCLFYLPGTHLLGERRATNFMQGSSQPKDSQLEPIEVTDPGRAISCPLRPGEVLVHHPLTWHMSPPNQTLQARCGWSLTFLHPDTCWSPSHAPHPMNHWLRPEEQSPLCPDIFPRIQLAEA